MLACIYVLLCIVMILCLEMIRVSIVITDQDSTSSRLSMLCVPLVMDSRFA
jgi:hypothetical protein